MKYYIVDDNIATVKSLENIIKSRNLGKVCGYSTSPEAAIPEILEEMPEIVLVDFLMEGMDGVEMIEQISSRTDKIYFVMISKVTDKEMIQTAYQKGIEFFIHKPVNIVEVETVLNKLMEKIKLKGMLHQLKSIMTDVDEEPEKKQTAAEKKKDYKEIDHLLGNLGMLGERGSQDIRKAHAYMMENQCEYGKDVLNYLEEETKDTAKNIEQRIRRAMKKGLTNTARIMIDDAYSDILSSYSNYVFDFSTISDEINYINGKSTTGGRVNIARFMDGLKIYSKS
ncbi:MAG: DNA-binding domain-containing protein [Firmicutes bacterium]|nr:DNA-binding domain-containing protein [Bacillota bacterium]